nr:hypothetical protein [Azospirillum halopraeferens]
MSIHLTRPMTKVAAEPGISDAALRKICEKHRIPAPGRGHWAKVTAGKPPKRALFRDVSDPLGDRILDTGQSRSEAAAGGAGGSRQGEGRARSHYVLSAQWRPGSGVGHADAGRAGHRGH